jgi:hypothetical protein
LKVNVGSGGKKLEGYVNIDCQPATQPDVVCDISKDRWPFDDNSVEGAHASHIFEHLAPGEPFFHCLRELYRVCRNGAKVEVILPHPRHDIFLNDPSHLQALMPGTFVMFSKRLIAENAAKGQILTPFCDFIGVDFDLRSVEYSFDPMVDKDDPELEWKAKHLANIIFEWRTTLTVVK